MQFGDKLKELRTVYGMSQGQLAYKLGVTPGTIAHWESGRRSPNYEMINNLSEIFNVTADYLIGKTTVPDGKVITSFAAMKTSVTVYGRIPAGVPFEAIEDICDEIQVPSWLEKKKDLFGLLIVGDSMSKVLPDGAVAVLQKCDTLNNGEIGAIMVNGYDATIKRFYKLKSGVVLEPDSYNTEHKPIVIEEGAESVRIIGKVLWFCAPNIVK